MIFVCLKKDAKQYMIVLILLMSRIWLSSSIRLFQNVMSCSFSGHVFPNYDLIFFYFADWYMHVRNMTIVNVPLTFVCCVLTIIAAVIISVWRYPRAKTKNRYVLILAMLALSATAIFASGEILNKLGRPFCYFLPCSVTRSLNE